MCACMTCGDYSRRPEPGAEPAPVYAPCPRYDPDRDDECECDRVDRVRGGCEDVRVEDEYAG